MWTIPLTGISQKSSRSVIPTAGASNSASMSREDTEMKGRAGREMEDLLKKMDEQFGPLEKWSSEALAVLDI